MNEIIEEQYLGYNLPEEDILALHKVLKLPDVRLSPFARPRRLEALNEALSWEKGVNQENKIKTTIYTFEKHTIGVEKPGKEAAEKYIGCRHYKTGEKTNNPNDMLPQIYYSGTPIEKNLSFTELFEMIEKLMRKDIFGLELLGTMIFRNAFMLDHEKIDGNWRYSPPINVIDELEKRIPYIGNIPTKLFIFFMDVLSLNEDVKVHTLGYEGLKYDYGKINTILTFTHLIAVLLNRRPLSKFAGSLARPPSGIAAIPKTKAAEFFPLLSSNLNSKLINTEGLIQTY